VDVDELFKILLERDLVSTSQYIKQDEDILSHWKGKKTKKRSSIDRIIKYHNIVMITLRF